MHEEKPASPRGQLYRIQRCPGSRLPMIALSDAVVIEDFGVRDDRHARAGSDRQILLLEKETLDQLGLQPGEVKENFTTSGIDLRALNPGARLGVGAEAILEITKPCAPCARMEEIRPGLLREIAGRRGMLARVLRGGAVKPGDSIHLLT